jgi:hypothetical protein
MRPLARLATIRTPKNTLYLSLEEFKKLEAKIMMKNSPLKFLG